MAKLRLPLPPPFWKAVSATRRCSEVIRLEEPDVALAHRYDLCGVEREVRTSKDSTWRAAGQPASPAIEPHLVYRARLTNLVPGEEFRYRVLKGGKPVFDATAPARKSTRQSYHFVLFGDCGQGTPAENAVACQACLGKPDFLLIPADIVYGSGRISEYRTKFYPTYVTDELPVEWRAAAAICAVLLLFGPTAERTRALSDARKAR